jgi:YihY family inner membrane protein
MGATPRTLSSAGRFALCFLFSLGSVAWLLAMLLSFFGGPWAQSIAAEFAYFPFHTLWIGLLQLLAMILAMFVLALIYRVATPGRTTWGSVLPGAAAATIVWWGVSVVFGFYVSKTQYGLIYGGLAAAIGLMTWMAISATLIFFGAAWNSDRAPRKVYSCSVRFHDPCRGTGHSGSSSDGFQPHAFCILIL